MKKYMEILTASLFCGFLGIMGILYFIQPSQDFSVLEKRYLAEKPECTFENVVSGNWGSEAETYLADHMPARDFFVGLNAYYDYYTGRQKTKEIWTYEDRLLEAPKKPDREAAEKNMRSVNAFAETAGVPADLLLIPSAGWYCGLPEYEDGEIIDSIYSLAGDCVNPMDLKKELSADCFYRTDHHWTSEGAFKVYAAYVRKLKLEPVQDFRKETYEGFHGSTYSRSGLWLTPSENIELWYGSDSLTAETEEGIHEGCFYLDKLQDQDMYTVFLGGNHPVVRIHNPEKEGKLLVIRDSYSNCLGSFLAESFGEVVLIDLRYYKQSMSKLAAEENFDRILVCYSLSNFLTDKNLVFLRR